MNAKPNGVLPDDVFRKEIVTTLDENFLVEAGAGTGKTTALIGRMLALLKQGKCSIDTLAAITFTRKAAAELRSRFQVKLEDETRQAHGEERERLANALQRIEQCFIGTIHSFCARLLRERPVEACVHVSFSELDDDADRVLRRQSWEEYADSLYCEDGSPTLAQLDEVGLNIGQLKSAFLTITNYPDVDEWPSEQRALPDAQAFVTDIQDYVKHIEEIQPEFPQDVGNDELMLLYVKLARMVRFVDFRKPGDVIDVLTNCKAVKVIQKQWPRGNQQAKDERDRWEAFCQQYQPLLHAFFSYRYHIALSALQSAVAFYEQKKRLLGVLNFQDLLLRTAAMLRNSAPVRQYFQERITHLLVDEFQDTDPIQAEVMLLLTGENLVETRWGHCRPAPGSLFVVGDPKQSIYRFRRADIQVYNQVKAIIQKHGGRVGALTTNFRTDAPVLHWVNKVFQPLFPGDATAESPQYIPLEAPTSLQGKDHADVFALSAPEECATKDEIVLHDAKRVAAIIQRDMKHQRRQAGDFMIVTYKKQNMAMYAHALQRLGVPHQVTGGGALNDNEALHWLALCIRAVIEPDNPVALVALLRSDLFGFSDPELFAFKQAGGAFHYAKKIPGELQEANLYFVDVFFRLKQYAAHFNNAPLVVALQAIIDDLGLYAWCSVQPDSNHLAGGLAKLVEVIRSRQHEWTSVADMLAYLHALDCGEEVIDGIEAQPPLDPGVQIMNLHKVKGLEAPVVILADPNGYSNRKPTAHIVREQDRVSGYFFIDEPSPFGFHRAPLAYPMQWEELAETEQQFLDAEFHRLLYVAATRAKHQMIISQRVKRATSNPWNKLLKDVIEYPEDEKAVPIKPVKPRRKAPMRISSPVAVWQRLADPTYITLGAKDLITSSTPRNQYSQKSAGNESALEWGNYIHALLRLHLQDSTLDIESAAQRLSEAMDVDDETTQRGVALLHSVSQSSILKRAKNAMQFFTEIPFQVMRQSEQETDVPVFLRGVIDLVFKEKNGWVVIDYKTDKITKKTMQQRGEYYSPQINAYAEEWARIVNEPVVERGVFFVHLDAYFPISDTTALPA
ncbi:MAG: UvrD-helicase domain-containing protein [Candidatus Hinthialibacter antarcticus]|nr:UvrD-helicase domain-containing protein [Candidatus Hinthialibacter antarcticus]